MSMQLMAMINYLMYDWLIYRKIIAMRQSTDTTKHSSKCRAFVIVGPICLTGFQMSTL